MNIFLFKSEQKVDLNFFSRCIGLVCLVQLLLLFPDYYEIFGNKGLVQADLNDKFLLPFDISIHNISLLTGINDFILVNLFISLFAIVSLWLVIEGQKNYIAITLCWIIHICLINSSFLFSYGGDYMISFSLFYIFFSVSLLKIKSFFPKLSITNSEILSFATRILQLFICFVYFFSGFGKVLGLDWLNGSALWKVMVVYQYDLVKYASEIFPFVTWKIMGWIIVFVEICYPILVYNERTRKLCLAIILSMHIGIAFSLNLYIFALIMIALNLGGFGYLKYNTDDDKDKELALSI